MKLYFRYFFLILLILISSCSKEEKKVSILCIGKKGYDSLSVFNKENFDYKTKIINISDIDYVSVQNLGNTIIEDYFQGNFNECFILYNFFSSVISQEVKTET